MQLFGFFRKRREKKAEGFGCSAVGADKIKSVKVLGAGCKLCRRLYEDTVRAAEEVGIPVEVEYCTDMQKVAEYAVISLPAIVVNEKVVSTGAVLSRHDVAALLLEQASSFGA